jgi:signal transduction histidine kinase
MTLQAKLTLSTVLLATLIVAAISAVDLANIMQLQFESALRRADLVRRVAVDDVKSALNRPNAPAALRTALNSPELLDMLKTVMAPSREIFEVAVVDPDEVILADSFPERRGQRFPRYENLTPLVEEAGWYKKLQVLMRGGANYYQLERGMGAREGTPDLYVRVIVAPTFIRDFYIMPALKKSANIAVLSVAGAACLTFLFSAFAFRSLGRLRRQLDLLASGEYDAASPAPGKKGTDDVAIMSSKVSLLGERLRGAQYEVSDLRGNINRLLRDLEDAVFIFNGERRLVFASGSVEKFMERDRPALPGQSLAEIFPETANLGFLVKQTAETGIPIRNKRIPLAGTGAGAAVLLSVDFLEAQPGAVNPSPGLLVRLRDPEAQRQIGRQLQTADRLAAISRVTSGVAHEVKNPLNAILLHVEVARTRLARDETDIGPQMDIIAREILRLDRVVKTFLDFTRPVELKLVQVPLREMLSEIVELARPQAEAGKIQVVTELEAEDVEVRVDRDLFKQAVLNVVVNAMQAMPQGGELRFVTATANDIAEIRISDTGGGIPAELKEKIFRLYFTTKEGGSGIGLAMTFRIVQLHDGTIDFSSEPGRGTTFVIRLPIAV